MMVKAVNYIQRSCIDGKYWIDKWHLSPFYATARVMSAVTGLDPSMTRSTIHWLLAEQHEDGSWGLDDGSAEETAYAMETLQYVSQTDVGVSALARQSLERGVVYLEDHIDEASRPELWLGKGLYYPDSVVEAAILGALLRMTDRPLRQRPVVPALR